MVLDQLLGKGEHENQAVAVKNACMCKDHEKISGPIVVVTTLQDPRRPVLRSYHPGPPDVWAMGHASAVVKDYKKKKKRSRNGEDSEPEPCVPSTVLLPPLVLSPVPGPKLPISSRTFQYLPPTFESPYLPIVGLEASAARPIFNKAAAAEAWS